MLTIKVVGSGCANCQKLAEMCQDVLHENNIEATIEKVTDIRQFADLGIFITPGLIINDRVISSGKVPAESTLKQWIMDAAD